MIFSGPKTWNNRKLNKNNWWNDQTPRWMIVWDDDTIPVRRFIVNFDGLWWDNHDIAYQHANEDVCDDICRETRDELDRLEAERKIAEQKRIDAERQERERMREDAIEEFYSYKTAMFQDVMNRVFAKWNGSMAIVQDMIYRYAAMYGIIVIDIKRNSRHNGTTEVIVELDDGTVLTFDGAF